MEEVPEEFSTTINQPIFNTPVQEYLELPMTSAPESTTESSVTDENLRYQVHLTETLRPMTERLTTLSTQAPAAPQPPPKQKSRVKP